jgi:uncharacterized integral membrane protein (TIGR00697 family)
MFKNKAHTLFIILGGFFVTNALVAEFIGIKIFSLESTIGMDSLDLKLFGVEGLGFNMTAGVLLWPVVFVMTDVINEYYGRKGVTLLSYLTVFLISYAFIMIYSAIQLTPNDWWDNVSGINDDPDKSIVSMNLAYAKILGQGLWIILGSLVAFLVGQLLDVIVYQRIRKLTGESKVWLRATGSTMVSQFVDSYVVLIIAFYIGSDWALERVIAIGTVNYIYKFLMAILLTPLIYLVHYLIDRYLGKSLSDELKIQASTI